MPYLMDDYTGLNKIMQTSQYEEWAKEFADEHGVWLVTSNWYSGARNFCLNKTVNQPADLSGQRIRTIGNEICTTSINDLGAVATPMSWSEVYPSIFRRTCYLPSQATDAISDWMRSRRSTMFRSV